MTDSTISNGTIDACHRAIYNAGKNTKHLIAEAHEIKYGKRAMVYDVKIYDQDEVLLACGTFTFMSIGTKHEFVQEQDN